MSTKERAKRPKLPRKEPIRGWSTLFEPPSGEGQEPRPAAAASAAPGDVIAKSVELGYRVVDEYVRQGQRAARLLSQPSPNPQAVVGDVQRIYLDHLSQVARLWMDAMQIAVPVAGAAASMASPPPAPTAASEAAAPAPMTAPAERSAVRIEIAACQPVSVSLDLRPEAGGRNLVVHALRAAEAEKARLSDVTFHPATADEPARLRLTVPPGQASGTYSGLLVDAATNRPMGTLSVDVADA